MNALESSCRRDQSMYRRVISVCVLLAGCDSVFGLKTVIAAEPDAPCFVDTFSGDPFDPRWDVFGETDSNVMVSPQDSLQFHFITGAARQSYNNITAIEAHDFGAGYLKAELVDAPALHRESSMRLNLSTTEYFSLGLRFDSAANLVPQLIAKQGDGSLVFQRLYEPEQDHWFRIRFEGAQVTFETSPDGEVWEGKTTLVRLATRSLSIVFDAYVPNSANPLDVPDPEDDVVWNNVSMRALDCSPLLR